MTPKMKEALNALGTGALMWVFGGGIYWYLWDFENSADTTRRIHSLIAMLYNMGGKPLAVAPFFLLGIGLLGKGVFTLVKPGDA